MERGKPEIPLSPFVDSCAVDAMIVNVNRKTPEAAWSKSLWNNFVGKLAEAAFAEWTGIPRKRPKEGERRDRGDIDFGGSVKGAQFWKEVPGRLDQNWTLHSWEMNVAKWIVFIAVEMNRDIGGANELQTRIGATDLSLRRWISCGRCVEPIGIIYGWAKPEELKDLITHPNEEDGLVGPGDGYSLVNWRRLRAWPEHPRPTFPGYLYKLLEIGPTEGEKESFLGKMRESARGPIEP